MPARFLVVAWWVLVKYLRGAVEWLVAEPLKRPPAAVFLCPAPLARLSLIVCLIAPPLGNL